MKLFSVLHIQYAAMFVCIYITFADWLPKSVTLETKICLAAKKRYPPKNFKKSRLEISSLPIGAILMPLRDFPIKTVTLTKRN